MAVWHKQLDVHLASLLFKVGADNIVAERHNDALRLVAAVCARHAAELVKIVLVEHARLTLYKQQPVADIHQHVDLVLVVTFSLCLRLEAHICPHLVASVCPSAHGIGNKGLPPTAFKQHGESIVIVGGEHLDIVIFYHQLATAASIEQLALAEWVRQLLVGVVVVYQHRVGFDVAQHEIAHLHGTLCAFGVVAVNVAALYLLPLQGNYSLGREHVLHGQTLHCGEVGVGGDV